MDGGDGVLRVCLIALLLVLAGAAWAAPENRHAVAVIIGNKSYANGVPEVRYADRDAAAMKRFVIDVLGFRARNVIELHDATQAQMLSTFGNRDNFRGRAFGMVRPGKSDLLVFYSGHGVPGLSDRRGYLLPVDADPATADINGYPIDLLYANLGKLGARSVTVFIDACFSGNSQGGMLIRAASPVFVTAALPPAAGMTVLTAAQGDQVASWDERARHGLFTEHLLAALYGKADSGEWGNGDGAMTLGEVAAYLNDEMRYQARRQYTREQVPTVQGEPGTVLARYPPGHPPPRPDLDQTPASGAGLAVGTYPAPPAVPKPGDGFKDCDVCPQMVVVPAGDFVMGSPATEPERDPSEGPQRRIAIPRLFAVGRFEITFDEWDACGLAGGCAYRPDDVGWGRGRRPVVNVSWLDARAYLAWLSATTGKPYRLLSEAEWEYMARAGTTTARFWGASADQGCDSANAADLTAKDLYARWNTSGCRDNVVNTAPVGSFRPNGFGLHDTLGNVWEWVADCWDATLAGVPADGTARQGGDCGRRVLRGGAWDSIPANVRAARRLGELPQFRGNFLGFRVARPL